MPEDIRGEAAVASDARVVRFIHALAFDALPDDVVQQARRCLLDLIGVAAAGTTTRLSSIARDYAAAHQCGRDHSARILFDGRRASCAGAAFAGASTIDSIDGHDGHALTKGHAGVAILPALLALSDTGFDESPAIDGREFIARLVLGYEIATRAGIVLHASVSDYHCSGAWNAIGCAAVAARALRLDDARMREALGIAEYFGPRGQMLRTCAAPSMVKDGSGWGAHAGISAALLAREGFTGAPAVTVERDLHAGLWGDLGSRWRILEQYFKAYPVCRWAQPAIEAALALQRVHRFAANDIAAITIETFGEATMLSAERMLPQTTEDAQYSLSYPVAAALIFGDVGVDQLAPTALADARVRRLVALITLRVDRDFAARFPAERWSRVEIALSDGCVVRSEPTCARGDPRTPLTDAALRDKFFAFCDPVLGHSRAKRIEDRVNALCDDAKLAPLLEELLAA